MRPSGSTTPEIAASGLASTVFTGGLQCCPASSVAVAITRFGLAPERMCFVSSNAWDAHAAKANGYRVAWCNRFGQAPERIPATPDAEIADLSCLPDLLLGST